MVPLVVAMGGTGARLRSAERGGGQGDRTLNASRALRSPRATRKAGSKSVVSFITVCCFASISRDARAGMGSPGRTSLLSAAAPAHPHV